MRQHNEIYSEEYKGLTIRIYPDDDCSFKQSAGDEPFMILAMSPRGGREIYNNSKSWLPKAGEVLEALTDPRASSACETLCDYLGLETRKTAKRVGFEDNHTGRWRWFKNHLTMWAALLGYAGLRHVNVVRLSSQRDTYYFAWDQEELDAHAGCKNARPAIEMAQAILDGECYGYRITKRESEKEKLLEACWGFVGDYEYCLEEARAVSLQRVMERKG